MCIYYWETLIDRRSKDPKRLWTTFNGFLSRRSRTRCEQTSIPFTADVFLEKIAAKISSIRDATAPPPVHLPTSHRLSSLREITSAELRMFILAAAPKTCEFDPMPTFLVQDYVDVLLPFLTMMCNCSIREAQLPSSQKRSILHPVLKREGLDQTDPGNYHPIANVSFISKILECIIARQLVAYFDADDLLPAHQYGFRRNHSTETLLVRLVSDLHSAMDAGHVSLLALFDVSSAFDSVDHSILLQRLSTSFGLTDKPLEWLRSFLSERTNCVTFGSSRSAWVHAPFDFLHHSVIDCFCIYNVQCLYSRYRDASFSHGLLHQLYADNAQAYTHYPPDCAVTTVSQLCLAVDALSGCQASNRLLLNPTKTQFIWLGSRRRLANVEFDRCLVDEAFPELVFCDTVRDLGIILDQELNFSAQINQLTRSCYMYYQLSRVLCVTHYIDCHSREHFLQSCCAGVALFSRHCPSHILTLWQPCKAPSILTHAKMRNPWAIASSFA